MTTDCQYLRPPIREQRQGSCVLTVVTLRLYKYVGDSNQLSVPSCVPGRDLTRVVKALHGEGDTHATD